MTTQGIIQPWAIDAGDDGLPAYTGQDFRDLLAVFFEPGETPMLPKPGVLWGAEVTVTGNTATVKAGHAIVRSSRGSYLTGPRTQQTLTIPARHNTRSRVDVVALIVTDTGATGRGAKLELIAGTPSTSPTPPEVVNGLILATLKVPPSGAITVTAGPKTSLRGGMTTAPAPSPTPPEPTPTPTPPVKVEKINGTLGSGVTSGSKIVTTLLPGKIAVVELNLTISYSNTNYIGNTNATGFSGTGFVFGDNTFVPVQISTNGRVEFLGPSEKIPSSGTHLNGSLLLT